MKLQQQLFSARRMALQSSVGALQETITGYDAQLAGAIQLRGYKLTEQKALDSQLNGVRQLASEGYVPQSKLQDLEREDARLDGEISSRRVPRGN